jgi:hypothetical protein
MHRRLGSRYEFGVWRSGQRGLSRETRVGMIAMAKWTVGGCLLRMSKVSVGPLRPMEFLAINTERQTVSR